MVENHVNLHAWLWSFLVISDQNEYYAFFIKNCFKHSYPTEEHWSDIKCLKINYIFFK